MGFDDLNLKAGDYVSHTDLGIGKIIKIGRNNVYIQFSKAKDYFINKNKAESKIKKHYFFQVGDYVRHKRWGVGKITDLDENYLMIDFERKPEHRMGIAIAKKALTTQNPDGLIVACFHRLNELKEEIKTNPLEILKLLFIDYNGVLKREVIYRELVGVLLSKSEWDKWWKKTTVLMKADSYFDTTEGKRGIYRYRQIALEAYQETLADFNKAKNFAEYLRIVRKLLSDYSTNLNKENSMKVLEYFTKELENEDTTIALQSYWVLQDLQKPLGNIDLKDFNIIEILKTNIHLNDIAYADYQERTLLIIDKNLETPYDLYAQALYSSSSKIRNFALHKLQSAAKMDLLNQHIEHIISESRENARLFLWYALNFLDNVWTETQGFIVPRKQIMIAIIKALDSKQKSLYKRLYKIISDEDVLIEMYRTLSKTDLRKIMECYFTSDEIHYREKRRAYSLLEEEERFEVQDYFYELFEKESSESTESKNEYITRGAYDKLVKKYNNLLNVELPDATKAISVALEFGDLSENAEYDAAKERQHLIKTHIRELEKNLRLYQIIESNIVQTDRAMFGTKVTIKNKDTEEILTYSIMGPEESDFEKNIISYRSPIGAALIGHRLDEEVKVETPSGIDIYIILKIELDPMME